VMVSARFDNSRDSQEASANASVITAADGGAQVVWQSADPLLVSGDTNGVTDVFVRKLNPDGTLAPTQRVSVSTAGTQGNRSSTNPTLSANGRFVVFQSDADTLTSNDDNTALDIFVRD